MKRSILLAVSMLLLAPSLDAASWQCVPTQGCPKDQKPPACCEPPPCEFFFQMKLAEAIRHGFSLEVQRSAWRRKSRRRPRSRKVRKRTSTKTSKSRPAIREIARQKSKGKKHGPTPILTANAEQQCRITIYETARPRSTSMT